MKRITVNRAVWLLLIRSTFRSIGVVTAFAIMIFSVLSSWILYFGVKNGFHQVEERFGADILVISEDGELDVSEYFLQMVTSYDYFSSEYLEKIKEIEGVEKSSGQFFLASLGTGCCDTKVNIIGIDEETDFTIGPWLENCEQGNLEYEELFVGSEVNVSVGEFLKLFGKEYKVKGKLAATGTGLDQSVFASMETVEDIRQQAILQGYGFGNSESEEELLSAIYVNVAKDADVDAVLDEINGMDGIKGMKMQTLTKKLSDAFSYALIIWKIVFVLVFLIASILLIIISISSNEKRLQDLKILYLIGMSRRKCRYIFCSEKNLLYLFGSLIGLGVTFVGYFGFHVWLTDYFEIPFVDPGGVLILAGIVVAELTGFIVGPLFSYEWIRRRI